MRLPEPDGVMRMTISSVNPNQRLLSLASIRPAASSAATILHPIRWAGVERAAERRAGLQREGQWHDVGIGPPLLLSDLSTLIRSRIGAGGFAHRYHDNKHRRIIRIGRNVVDRRHRPADLIIVPGHIGDQPTDGKGEDGDRNSVQFDP